MRAAFVAFLLAAASLSSAAAETQPYRAGIARLLVQGNEPFSVLVWYPSPAEETEWQQGPFPIQATRDAPIAPGSKFPIVLFSHGGGASGGSPLIHREIARYLARAGFIVISPFHSADQPRLRLRPPQIRLAFEAVRADPRFGRRADAERVGMIGFSLGGAVALITAGAVPNLALLSAYCREHGDDRRACAGVPTNPPADGAPGPKPAEPLTLKAIVLLEPLAALFDRDGLAAVTMPVLLYRALQSDLGPEGNALALARNLPKPPREETVPGGHFVLADPCPPAVAAEAEEVCKDAAGIDRAAVQRRIESEIAEFLRGAL